MTIQEILKSDDLIKLVHKNNEYYYHPSITLLDMMDFQINDSIESFENGIEGFLIEKIFFVPSKSAYDKPCSIGITSDYPDDFMLFWNNYHTGRRKGKRDSLKAWLELKPNEKELLPLAAKNYTDEICASSSATYMRLPASFIRKKLFEDYCEKDKIIDEVIQFSEYYHKMFKGLLGFSFFFNQKEKNQLKEDLENIGFKRLQEMCFVFFKKLDHGVNAVNHKNHYSYGMFSMLIKGVLGSTKKTIQKKCEICGVYGGHTVSCELAPKEAAREEKVIDPDINIMDMFKKTIKRRGNICTEQ